MHASPDRLDCILIQMVPLDTRWQTLVQADTLDTGHLSRWSHWTLDTPPHGHTGYWTVVQTVSLETGHSSRRSHWTLDTRPDGHTGHWTLLQMITLDTGHSSRLDTSRSYSLCYYVGNNQHTDLDWAGLLVRAGEPRAGGPELSPACMVRQQSTTK